MLVINILLIILFIALTAFFVGAEFAILKVRPSQIDVLASQGKRSAIIAKKVLAQLDYHLSACQLGITVTALVLGALGEPTVAKLLAPLFEWLQLNATLTFILSYAISLFVITVLHVIIGELMPKTIAIQYAERMTLVLAPSLYLFGKITAPFIMILNGSARLLLKLLGIKATDEDVAYSEEELKRVVMDSYRGGEINATELAYVTRAFDFDKHQIKEIMIPLSQTKCLDAQQSLQQHLQCIKQYEHIRYPIVNSTVDKEAIIGFVNTKEMLTTIASNSKATLTDFIKPMPSFDENAIVSDVFFKMQSGHHQIALIMSHTNTILGIVTMEDLLNQMIMPKEVA